MKDIDKEYEELLKLEKKGAILQMICFVVMTITIINMCVFNINKVDYDVNRDGKVDMVDASLVENCYLGRIECDK